MSVRKTTEMFIAEAKDVHGTKYDYSRVEYVKNNINVIIICPIHGEFTQRPHNHIEGKGCRKCKGFSTLNTKDFITNAQKIHNNKYDYSKVLYTNSHTKVCIICPEHGEFWQLPNVHISQKSGCSVCKCDKISKALLRKDDDFIRLASTKHNNKYDYSKMDYIGGKVSIDIICPIHGTFRQTPDNHLQGCGCRQCGTKSKGELAIMNILDKLSIEYILQHTFNDCIHKRKLPFDFYIPKYDILIEYDGIQHFKSIKFFGGDDGFDKLKLNDSIKNKYCLKNKLTLIRIPYTLSTVEIENIIKDVKCKT